MFREKSILKTDLNCINLLFGGSSGYMLTGLALFLVYSSIGASFFREAILTIYKLVLAFKIFKVKVIDFPNTEKIGIHFFCF
jgi:hypothetical protein